MKNILNKIPNKLLIISSVLSVLSLIPMYFITVNILDMTKLTAGNTIKADVVDEIMSRNIQELKFLFPCIAITSIMVFQSILSALILKKYNGWKNNGFAIGNLFFGGVLISNLFLLAKFVNPKEKQNISRKSIIGLGTVTLSFAPLALFSLSMGMNSVDDPTSLSHITMSDQKGQENVIEIFTDGFDPKGALPLFKKDPLFKDFISMDRMVTAGFATKPSYSQMMGGVKRNPFVLQRELDNKKDNKVIDGLVHKDFDSYLHENFMDSVLKHLNADNFKNLYIGNPDDIGHFDTYFQHVSGNPSKLQKRNKDLYGSSKSKLEVFNWGQAKNETADFGINYSQNNVAVYRWAEQNIKVTHTGNGSRIFFQDSITHAPRVIGKGGSLSFSNVANSATINQSVAFEALHFVMNELINSLKKQNVYENTLIAIYGDHADHSNPIPNSVDEKQEYNKNHGQAIIKYPHVNNDSTNEMISNKTPFYGPNVSGLISDYFNNKKLYDEKNSENANNLINNFLDANISNKNHFITFRSLKDHKAAFVKWDHPGCEDAKLVPYTFDELASSRVKKDFFHNWVNYDDFLNIPKIEEEINGMGWE